MFPAPDRPLQNVATQNIFWRDLRRLFFFLVTENRDRKFQYCSRIYVQNWFTLLNEQNPLLDFEGTRFVNERSLFWRRKKKSPYLPTHRWNGVSGVGNEHIFKGGLGLWLHLVLWKDILTCGAHLHCPDVVPHCGVTYNRKSQFNKKVFFLTQRQMSDQTAFMMCKWWYGYKQAYKRLRNSYFKCRSWLMKYSKTKRAITPCASKLLESIETLFL